MLKLNNKYSYYKRLKMPILSDFISVEDYAMAITFYKIKQKVGHFIDVTSITPNLHLKETTYRRQNLPIEVGNTIYVERWDRNGIPKEVKIIKIKNSTSRSIVFTNKGWFMFSKWNCHSDDILFNWTCKGKTWEKKYMKWVNGSRYYLKKD